MRACKPERDTRTCRERERERESLLGVSVRLLLSSRVGLPRHFGPRMLYALSAVVHLRYSCAAAAAAAAAAALANETVVTHLAFHDTIRHDVIGQGSAALGGTTFHPPSAADGLGAGALRGAPGQVGVFFYVLSVWAV